MVSIKDFIRINPSRDTAAEDSSEKKTNILPFQFIHQGGCFVLNEIKKMSPGHTFRVDYNHPHKRIGQVCGPLDMCCL